MYGTVHAFERNFHTIDIGQFNASSRGWHKNQSSLAKIWERNKDKLTGQLVFFTPALFDACRHSLARDIKANCSCLQLPMGLANEVHD